jgi:hypothetical protein
MKHRLELQFFTQTQNEESGAPGEIRTPDPLLRRCDRPLDDAWPALFFCNLRISCYTVFGVISVRSAPKLAPIFDS